MHEGGCDMTTINVDETSSAIPISQPDHRETSFLTDRDVNEILERKLGSGKFRLVDWRLEPFGKTEGYLGQYYHLRVTTRADGETQSLRFFAKTPPPSSSPMFEFLQQYDLFNKEIAIYTDLLRRMGTGGPPRWTVECYLCKRDVIIVLEDASIDGYASLDKYVPFDEEHCVWLLRTLSRLHARSLILEEGLGREGGRCTFLDLYGHLLNEVLFREGDDSWEKTILFISSSLTTIRAIADLVQEINDDERFVVGRRLAEWSREISRLLAPSLKHRNVICHRDIWANNIMFRHDLAGNPNGCYVIDFQFWCYSPPAIDFACFLYLTTNRAVRDHRYDTFAKIYHDSFARCLAEEGLDVEDYLSWTAFRESCAEARNIALVYAALNLPMMLLSSEAHVDHFQGAPDDIEAILFGDERAKVMCREYERFPAFRKRILEIILEIKDRLPDHPPNLSTRIVDRKR